MEEKRKWRHSICMKRLLASLRDKKRYIAFEVESAKNLSKNELYDGVVAGCKNFLGDYTYGKAGVRVLNEFLESKKGIVRVRSGYVNHAKSSLMLIKKINGIRVIFKNKRVSGSLRNVKNKLNEKGGRKGG